MPKGVVRIAYGIDTDWIERVAYVQQDSVPGTRPRGQPDGGVDRYVVALVGARRGLCAWAVGPAFPEAIDSAGLRIGKDTGAGYDLRQLRLRQRNPDDIDAE